MLRRLGTNRKSLVIIPVALALALTWLFLPVKEVSIEPYGTLSLESRITLSVGYEAAYANPAAPVYQEFTEAKAGSDTNTINVNKPPGTAVGDLLIAGMTTDGPTSLTPPAGWTEISQGISGNKLTSGSWWKIASSDPPEPDYYTFTHDGSETIYIFIIRITGAHPTAPVDVSWFAAGQTQYPQCPTVTTTVADTLVLRLFGADDCDIRVDDPNDYPAGHTGITLDDSGGSQPASGGAAWKEQVLAGDTTTASFTLTAAEEWYATTIAIKPPAPDIANTPTSKDFGQVTTSTSYWSKGSPPNWDDGLNDGECFFKVTNNSGAPVNIAIRATDFEGGAKGWILGGTAGEDIVVLKAGASGTTADENAMFILTNDDQPNFISSLAASASKWWELKMETPASFSNTNTKTAIITLTATLS